MRPGVGLVSSVVCGSGERTFGAALENAQLGTAVAPTVVTAHRVFGRPITVGKSMAMRRADLERVGGWEHVAGVLAEDDCLGQRFHALGYGVELCLDPVHNRNVSGLPHAHRRAPRPLGEDAPRAHPARVPLRAAALPPDHRRHDRARRALRASRARLVLCALALQTTGALLCHTLLHARRPFLLAAIEPLRTAAAFIAWALAVASRRVSWRGNAFLVGRGSRLVPVAPGEGRSAAEAVRG